MKIHCPQCQTQYPNIPERFRNRKVVCKKCQFRFKVIDQLAVEMPQETRLAVPQELVGSGDLPQETRLEEPVQSQSSESALQESIPQTFSAVAKAIGFGSEYLLQYARNKPNSESDWQSGDVIMDMYRIKALLGEGQFGKVYQVRHQHWALDLALKTPKSKALSVGAENIIKEAETWVNLPLHPNIVNCYYVRKINGVPQIFSEYVDGGDLKQQINSQILYHGNQKQILNRILDISIQFAWGLYFAHKQGLIHQDIKPANVMLSADGVVKITDFGLARLTNTLQNIEQPDNDVISAGMTPAYASPEQLAGKPLTHRTDIWSWAVCVLEMLLGYCSWEAGAVAPGVLEAYLEQSLDADPVVGNIPDELEQIISQCFEEEESLRPENMLVLAQELVSVYRHLNGRAYPRVPPQLGSETASSYNNQAISLVDLGRSSEALKLWQKALAIEPQHFESIYNLSLIQWQEQGLEEVLLFKKLSALLNKDSYDKSQYKALSRLYLQFSQYDKAINQLNNSNNQTARVKFSSLPDKPDNDYSPEFGLALCAYYRLAKDPVHWQYIAQSLQPLVEGKTNDPYAIIAFVLALQKSGQKKRALEFYKMIHDSGIIPLSFKQAVRLYLPGYEVLYRLPEKNIGRADFAKDADKLIFSQANQIILWHLQTATQLSILQGHTVKITALDYALKHGLIVSGSQQGNIRVWDEKARKQINVWFAHQSPINALQVSPCGNFVITAAQEKKLYLWEINSGNPIQAFYGEGHDSVINDVSFSPCGQKLLSAGADKVLRIWNSSNGHSELILRGHEHEVSCVLWINDRVLLSAGKDSVLIIWFLEQDDSKKFKLQSKRILKGHKGSVDCITVSSKYYYAVSGGSDGMVRYWNLNSGKSFTLHHFDGPVLSLSLDHSEQFILVTSRKGLAILEVNNPYRYQARLLFSVPQSAHEVDKYQAQYLQLIKSAAAKQHQKNYIQASRELEQARTIPGYEQDKKSYNDWTSLYQKLPGLALKNAWQDREEKISAYRINSLCSSLKADCFYLADQEGLIRQWQANSFSGHEIIHLRKPVTRIKLTTDERSLLFSSEQNIHLMDINSAEYYSSFYQHNADISCFDLTPDGRFVVSADSQGGCFLWRLLTGEITADYSDSTTAISYLLITPDGKKIISAAINSNSLIIRDIQNGKIISQFDAHDKPVTSLAISLDGRYLLTGSVDAMLCLWPTDSKHKKPKQKFRGHSKRIFQAVMDDQARIVVSISADRSLKIWQVDSGECLYSFTITDTDFSSVAISSDRKFIIAGRTDGGVMSWCLDWLLDQTLHTGWDRRADIYIHNYLMSRKITRPTNETEQVMKILNRAGFGFLTKEEIEFHLAETHENILQQRILTGSVTASATQLSSNNVKNNNRSKKLLPLIAAASVVIVPSLFFINGKISEQNNNETVEIIKLNQTEMETVNRLARVGIGLAGLNRMPVITNNRVNVNALIVPENIDKLESWLQLEPEQLEDSWGHPFEFTGVTSGAFKGRIILRSSGADGLFKTDDDLLLNGYPYLDSLAVRKGNKIISRLSDLMKAIVPEAEEESLVNKEPPAGNQLLDYISDNDSIDEIIDSNITEEPLLEDENEPVEDDIRIEEDALIGVEVKF